MGPTLQNLDACFLTFHSLSTPFQSISLFPILCLYVHVHVHMHEHEFICFCMQVVIEFPSCLRQVQTLIGWIFVGQVFRRSMVLACPSSCHYPSLGLLSTSSKFLSGITMESMNVQRPILYCELLIIGSEVCKLIILTTSSLCPTIHIGGEIGRIFPSQTLFRFFRMQRDPYF